MKMIGTWWNDRNIDLVEVEGRIYALSGWNGECYLKCWECTGEYNMDASKEEYILSPIYGESDNIINYEVQEK